MEEASDGIVMLDLEGYFRVANAKACAMFGYTKEELLQLHVTDTCVPAEKTMRSNAWSNFRKARPCALHAGYSETMGRSFRSKLVHRSCPTITFWLLYETSLGRNLEQ